MLTFTHSTGFRARYDTFSNLTMLRPYRCENGIFVFTLTLTMKSYGNAKASHDVNQMHSYRVEGSDHVSLLLFFTHYLRYLDIHPPDDLCITSYCYYSILLNREGEFHVLSIRPVCLQAETNEPDSTDPIFQIGWFHTLKGCLSHM
jgi:hypothetical protein